MDNNPESPKKKHYFVVNTFGTACVESLTVEDAWKQADRYDSLPRAYPNGPHTVVEYVPVPRPIPARPTAVIAVFPTEVRNGGMCCALSGQPVKFEATEHIRAAAQLIADTNAWEAAHGGECAMHATTNQVREARKDQR